MKADTENLTPASPRRDSAPMLESHLTTKSAKTAPALRLDRLLLVVLAVLGVGFVVGLVPRMLKRAAVKKETRELSVQTVNVIFPVPASAAAPLSLSGELKPQTEAPIYARVSGYVRRWLVDMGAQVEAGQLLAEIETPELDRELAEARAGLLQVEAARDLAGTTAKRWREMLAGRTVSPQEADEKSADLTLKKATVDVARAKVQRLEEVNGFARITAPFAGAITARKLDVGQLVTAAAGQELFRLAKTEKLRVFVRVPQNYARAVAVGQSADLVLTELPGRKFEGKIVRTAGALDPGSRTLLTEIEVDNAKGDLLAGSYAQVRLADTNPEPVLTLLSNAVFFRSDGAQVALLNRDNRASLRKVILGRDFGPTIEVLSGVTKEDRVIVNPPDSLVDGTEVRSVELKPGAK